MVSSITERDYYIDDKPVKVITKKDLWIIAFRGLFMEGNFNFQRYQGGGWLFTMVPGLKKIHTNYDDLCTSLKNHTILFNASPKLFTFIVGAALAMEENKETPSAINAMKVAGMGPSGGIGDAIDHNTLFPISLAIGASIALSTQSILGAIVYFVLYQTIAKFVYFALIFVGYNAGTKALANLEGTTEKISNAATIVGVFVIGALVATYVHLTTTLKITLHNGTNVRVIDLQTAFFDKIMPNLLPLLLLLIIFKLVRGKGFWSRPSVLIFSVIIVGTIGHLIGVF